MLCLGHQSRHSALKGHLLRLTSEAQINGLSLVGCLGVVLSILINSYACANEMAVSGLNSTMHGNVWFQCSSCSLSLNPCHTKDIQQQAQPSAFSAYLIRFCISNPYAFLTQIDIWCQVYARCSDLSLLGARQVRRLESG